MIFRIKFEYENTGILEVVTKEFEDWFACDYWSEKEKVNRGADFYYIQ